MQRYTSQSHVLKNVEHFTSRPTRFWIPKQMKIASSIWVPGMFGWLLQVKTFLKHFKLWQVVVATVIVLSWRVFTSGSSAVQMWQNCYSINSWAKKTTCFGWVWRLSSVTWTLKVKKGSFKLGTWCKSVSFYIYMFTPAPEISSINLFRCNSQVQPFWESKNNSDSSKLYF